MDVKFEADAFRVWRYSAPRGWDCTTREIATALQMTVRRVTTIVSRKRWSSRIRSLALDNIDFGTDYRTMIDNQLDHLASPEA